MLELVLRVLLIGLVATALSDLWAVAAHRIAGIPRPDWGLVGRWFAHLARGRIAHENIARSAPVAGERVLGWCGHYVIGVAFAALLVSVWGYHWVRNPTLWPALIVGWATIAFPFFLMQPGMGAGFAASKTPNPNLSRARSLLAHTVFGFSLYAAAELTRPLF